MSSYFFLVGNYIRASEIWHHNGGGNNMRLDDNEVYITNNFSKANALFKTLVNSGQKSMCLFWALSDNEFSLNDNILAIDDQIILSNNLKFVDTHTLDDKWIKSDTLLWSKTLIYSQSYDSIDDENVETIYILKHYDSNNIDIDIDNVFQKHKNSGSVIICSTIAHIKLLEEYITLSNSIPFPPREQTIRMWPTLLEKMKYNKIISLEKT